MAKAETMSTRSPRGTKPVSQAFFAALEGIPTASRPAVAKAAQAMIRDELKSKRDMAKVAATKQKAIQPPATKKLAVAKKPAVAKLAVKMKTVATKAKAPAPNGKTLKAAQTVTKKMPEKKVTAAKVKSSKPVEAPSA